MRINNRKLPRFNRRLFCRKNIVEYFTFANSTGLFSKRSDLLRFKSLAKKKEPQSALFFWSRRQELPSATAAPCILMARQPSQATVPVSPLLAKNSPPDCFLNAQTFSGSSPWQRKKEPNRLFFLWSRRQDLNLRHLGPKPSTLPN